MNKENVYEGLFILNSDAYARNPEEVSGPIAKTIESLGGVVRVSRLWDERKLAYAIKNHRRGAYWLAYFRIATDKVADLKRQFQLNNNIIRFQIISLDPRLEETLVQHALAGPAKVEEEETQDVYEEEDEETEAEETAE
ncbi:MAG: 30S ribosomal protein S6 [Thermoguttaceae bacterium]|nr:30S ribosomal protein S6 [Thermoguttaceae bacterium]